MRFLDCVAVWYRLVVVWLAYCAILLVVRLAYGFGFYLPVGLLWLWV